MLSCLAMCMLAVTSAHFDFRMNSNVPVVCQEAFREKVRNEWVKSRRVAQVRDGDTCSSTTTSLLVEGQP